MQHNLPQYRCHKVVGAARISTLNGNLCSVVTQEEPCLMRTIELDAGAAERISRGMAEHESGYLVEYEDGYISFSPPAAFHSGYAPLCAEPPPLDPHAVRDLIHEVRYLRRRNEVLSAQGRVLDLLGALVRPEGGAMSIDVAAHLERQLSDLEQAQK